MIIVAFTSWKKRINNVAKVVFNISNQTIKPDLIELNLCIEEFPNKEKDLPLEVNLLLENNILHINWVDKNTYTFKKFIPTLQKHYGEDYYLITIDDDTLYSKNLVQRVMEEHIKDPAKALGNKLFYWDNKHNNIPVLWQVRLFPPNCMFNLSEEYFINYFKNLENDIFYGICLKLNNTKCKCVNIPELVEQKEFFGQENKLNTEYSKPENSAIKFYENFIADHPELLEIIKQNERTL